MTASTNGHSGRRPWQVRGGRRAGFSMAELLIAIGILGIGLTLASALFPAAIMQNTASFEDTVGDMICHNALATAKAKILDGDSRLQFAHIADPNLVDITEIADTRPSAVFPANKPLFSRDEFAYPSDPDPLKRRMGFRLLQRRLPGSGVENDHVLVVVAYGLEEAANNLKIEKIDIKNIKAKLPNGTFSTTVTADIPSGCAVFEAEHDADGAKLKLGTPMIDSVSGKYALVTGKSVTGTRMIVTLNHAFDQDFDLPFIVYEEKGGKPFGQRSPAMSVLVNRTSLRTAN